MNEYEYRCKLVYLEEDGTERGDCDIFTYNARLHNAIDDLDYALKMKAHLEGGPIPCDVFVERRPIVQWERAPELRRLDVGNSA